MNTELTTMVHASSGSIALALGMVGMVSRKRRGLHTSNGSAFHLAVLITCVTASLLAFESWETHWWLFLIALLSYVAVLLGHIAARVRWKGWIECHIICLCSAYISMTTAFLVVNRTIFPKYLGIPSYWTWIVPTIIGTPLIARATGRYAPKKAKRKLK